MFWRLQVDLRTKLVLVFLCGLGMSTCACAIVKTILLPNLLSTDLDKTWIVAQLCLWAPLELCVGMICGSMPTLRPLVSHWQKKGSTGPYYDDRTKSAMKLGSHEGRMGKASRSAGSDYPSFRGIKSLEPSSSAEQGFEEEHHILKTHDVETSFNRAELPGNTPKTYEWKAV
ncbi:MAG: hypothetical protein Q9212_004235 [Teloschistes hypoglaucus]